MLDKLKQLYQLQQQAGQIKAQLDQELIETNALGIKIIMNGNLDIKSLAIEKEIIPENLEEDLKNALNQAIKNTQQKIAQKLSANFNLPI